MLDRLPKQDLSTSQGSLMLFADECCHDPISESSVPLISGDCQGAPFAGIRGVVLTSLPTCPDYGPPPPPSCPTRRVARTRSPTPVPTAA
ncbi:hypothetical protein F5X98DRAFT_338323 [Xylaria grammica]|nr:hypothetical protein F5X98DRAFT_338323 [Xylaria grammica]